MRINNKIFRRQFLLFFCAAVWFGTVAAQQIRAPQLSEAKAAMYSQSLRQHAAMVAFIENALAQNGLPKMLRNLAMIESDFDKNCVSSAQAAGVWQFTPSAAAYYGLPDSSRFDVYVSTLAAVKNLKDLYGKYRNWITVIAAYNCGEGNVNKAMRRAGSDRYEQFYTYLPAETINHVYKFMTACEVTQEFDYLNADYKLFLLNVPSENGREREKPQDTTTAANPALVAEPVNASFSLQVIADELHITTAELKSWNPDMDRELAQTGTCSLYLPVDLMPDFLLLKNEILNRSLLNAKPQ